MKHFLLIYDYAPDWMEKRGAVRPAHLELARAAADRGELHLGGAVPSGDPAFGLLLFKSETPQIGGGIRPSRSVCEPGCRRQMAGLRVDHCGRRGRAHASLSPNESGAAFAAPLHSFALSAALTGAVRVRGVRVRCDLVRARGAPCLHGRDPGFDVPVALGAGRFVAVAGCLASFEAPLQPAHAETTVRGARRSGKIDVMSVTYVPTAELSPFRFRNLGCLRTVRS